MKDMDMIDPRLIDRRLRDASDFGEFFSDGFVPKDESSHLGTSLDVHVRDPRAGGVILPAEWQVPGMQDRIAELEKQVAALTAELAALRTQSSKACPPLPT